MNNFLIQFSLLITLFSMVFATQVAAEQKPALHWGYVHFPPFFSETAPGKVDGEMAELINRLMQDLQREVNPVQYPNRRMISLLNEGKLDLAMVMSSVLTEPHLYYRSEKPVAMMELAIYWQPGTTPVQQLSELHNSRLIVMSGFSYGGLRATLEPDYGIIRHLIEIEQHSLGLTALQLNRGDYLLNYRHVMPADSEQQLQFHVISNFEMFLWLRKTLPCAEQLIQQIDALLAHYDAEAAAQPEKLIEQPAKPVGLKTPCPQ